MYVLLLGAHWNCDTEVCVHTADFKFCSSPVQKWPVAPVWKDHNCLLHLQTSPVTRCGLDLPKRDAELPSPGHHFRWWSPKDVFFRHWLKNALWACEELLKCIMMRLEKNKMSLFLRWLLKIYEAHFVPAKQTQLPPACLQEKCPL